MSCPILAIVIPCLNEQDLIEKTVKKLLEQINKLSKLGKISSSSFLYLIDDGSTDNTWQIMQQLHKENSQVKVLKLARNFGNQNAMLAGLLSVQELSVDCIITIDADLQQDENAIIEFIEKYKNGADIVCGIRNDRDTDSFIKKHTALMFYKLMNAMGVKITKNHSDYRLISKKVLDVLCQYNEVNLFLRGIFNEIGFKKDYVFFDVRDRAIGESRYTFRSLFSLALNGIISFSVVPLRVVGVLGLLMALFSFIFGIEVLIEKYILGTTIPGWTTIVLAILFIGGMQIFCIGIIGEYLGQTYKEVKARPRFIKDTELL